MTFAELIQQEIKEGYRAERTLEPLKCHWCDSENLEDRNHMGEDGRIEEYEKHCNDCDKLVGIWSYGYWQL